MRSLFVLLALMYCLPSLSQMKVTDVNSLRKQVLDMAEGSGMTPWEVIQGLKEGFQSSNSEEEDSGHGSGSTEAEKNVDESLAPLQGWLGELEAEFMRDSGNSKDEKKVSEIKLDSKNVTELKPTDVSGKGLGKVSSNTSNSVSSAPPNPNAKLSQSFLIPFLPQGNPNLSVQNSLKEMLAESNRQESSIEKPKRPMEIKARVLEIPSEKVKFSNNKFVVNLFKPVKNAIGALAKLLGLKVTGSQKGVTSKNEKVRSGNQGQLPYPIEMGANEEILNRIPANHFTKTENENKNDESDFSDLEALFGSLGWGFAFFILFIFLRNQKKKDQLKNSQA